eukprot:jgi/Psemu1/1790/gm1.1790_g
MPYVPNPLEVHYHHTDVKGLFKVRRSPGCFTIFDSSLVPSLIGGNFECTKWYECASTCLKNIFKHYLFTKVTTNGEVMPSDLLTEKHVVT